MRAVLSTTSAGPLANNTTHGTSASSQHYEPKASCKAPSRRSSHPTPHDAIATNICDSKSHRTSTRICHKLGGHQVSTRDRDREDSQVVTIRKGHKSTSQQDFDDADGDCISYKVLVRNGGLYISPLVESGPSGSCQSSTQNRSRYSTRQLAIKTTCRTCNRAYH